MSETEAATNGRVQRDGIIRAVIGLAQGIALYGLFNAAEAKTWPAIDPPLFAALCATAVFVPLLIVSALTQLRLGQLLLWTAGATAVCAALGGYDIWRDPGTAPPRIVPTPQLWFALSLGLFIAQSLIVAGAQDRRIVAHYPTYFGISWKFGLQAVLAAAFAGVFWLVLVLGAELFKLIRIDALSKLIGHSWFWIPATTFALSCAIHVTDIRVGIIRGVRMLTCNLLSWLLPLLTALAIGFVIALPFTGLNVLWDTKHASSILLSAAAGLIFLINAGYQDGARAEPGDAAAMPRVLHISVVAASLVLPPLVTLAAYGIALRTIQHGWTPDRIVATACALIAACYAIGYSLATIKPGRTIQPFQTTNVATAIVILATMLALLSPIADPARLSVRNQMARLQADKVSPENFDYAFLRFDAGKFGNDALRELSQRSDVGGIKAAAMLKETNRYAARSATPGMTPDDRTATITVVRPQGEKLPASFLATDWTNVQPNYAVPGCLKTRGFRCDAIFADLDNDGQPEIVLLPIPSGRASVFKSNGDKWEMLGSLESSQCPGIRDALLAGMYELVQPALREFDVGGKRLSLTAPIECDFTRRADIKR